MELSHAIEKSASITDITLHHLRSTIMAKVKGAQQGETFEDIEKDLHAAFIEAERAVLSEVLGNYDIDLPTLVFEGKALRQVVRCEQTYTSAVGPVRVARSLYREKHGANSICPLELRAGMVEKRWTPRAAKQALLAVSQLTPYEAEHLFGELGGMQPSKSSLDRLPKKLSNQWEQRREAFEQSLRQQFAVPEEAVTLAVSLDGVLVPMQGGVVMPGDSRYEEASCGTLSYYDEQGEPLAIRRYGCMPEHKKMSLKAFLRKEVNYALDHHPNLQLVKVADGAKDNWTFLEDELPKGRCVLDFYHAAEHLKKAFEIAYGVKEAKSDVEYSKYRSILRHDERGIDKVIAHLSYLLRKNPRKVSLKTEINYFKNNKRRCRYAAIANANFPIGSGIVEATCKTLVTQRLKRSGMCWKEQGGQAILTFRALLQSNLFDRAWEELSAVYRDDVRLPENVVAFP